MPYFFVDCFFVVFFITLWAVHKNIQRERDTHTQKKKNTLFSHLPFVPEKCLTNAFIMRDEKINGKKG